MSVSATVIARDEEVRIARCLESLGWADEIVVVVDDRTSDTTAAVAQRYTDRVFVRPFAGYAAQRQWAQEQAQGEWIFWVDCDEIVSLPLAEEVRVTLARPEFTTYRVPRLDYMFGRWIRHGGWYPQYQVRLFRKDGASWTRMVHERIDHTGPVGTLHEPVRHFSHMRVVDWLEKMEQYTTLEASELYDSGRKVGIWGLVLEPSLYSSYRYFVRQGFRDGRHGLALALLLGCYRLVRNLKVWDLQQSSGGAVESAESPPRRTRR